MDIVHDEVPNAHSRRIYCGSTVQGRIDEALGRFGRGVGGMPSGDAIGGTPPEDKGVRRDGSSAARGVCKVNARARRVSDGIDCCAALAMWGSGGKTWCARRPGRHDWGAFG